MLGLCLAFRHVELHSGDYEQVALDGDKLKVEVLEGRCVSRAELNRCWAQVVCASDGSSVALRSHGREFEIGRHMNEQQRLALARELRQELRGAR